MTIYNVHIYREMRLFFPAIEACTPEEAAGIAADRSTAQAHYAEDCDGDNLAALIDVAGDDEFTQSVTIDFEAERLRKAAPKLLEALDYLLAQTVDMDLKYGITLSEGEEDARATALSAIAEATRRAGVTLTNSERATRCQTAIIAYSDDDTYTNLVDFLADAMHCCHLKGQSFLDALDTARMHFEAELTGDDIFDELQQLVTNERNEL